MKPEERLKLLKKTLKKSTALTEKLLQRLDREWDDIYKEDSEHGKETSSSTKCGFDLLSKYFLPFQMRRLARHPPILHAETPTTIATVVSEVWRASIRF